MEDYVSRSGGVDLQGTQIDIGGDVVGRDKIVQNINHIVKTITQRPLTAAEEADLAQSIESKHLRQGVTDHVERLRDRVTATTDTGGPYKGLLEFRLSDAAVFFGRQQAISDLLQHVQRSPLTILHAESGTGKTSLLQAGISPRLIAKGHLPLYLRPYNISPTIAVKRAFLANPNETPNLAQLPLRDFLSRLGAVLGAQMTLYLFIDQFEEFFTHLEEARRAEYVNEFATCLEDDSLNVRWVLALRSEFFGNLASFRPRIRNPFENDYRLNRLTRAEARDAIAAPAAQKGMAFEDGLIDAILDDLGQVEVAPPQVQLVCSALYETLPDDAQVITRQSYAEQRGAKGILQEHLGRVLHRDLPADQRPIAQYALEALVTSDGQRVLRSRTELATDLTLRDAKPDILDRVLSQLVDSRLLRAEEIGGQLSYELAHDYLLSEIQLDPAVQARKAAQELLEQEVQAYQRYGTLLSDDKFAILAPRRGELALSTDAQALLHKSERALKRRQRLVFGGIGLVMALIAIGLLSIVTAIGAGRQQQAALRSQQIAETAAASANMQRTDALSSAEKAQASRTTAEAGAAIASTREAVANEALRRAFQQTGVVQIGNGPSAFAFDGTRLWVANSGDNTVQAIDPATWQVGTPIKFSNTPGALAFDGKRVWVAFEKDSVVQYIDPATDQVGERISIDGPPSALAFDGKQLWVASSRAIQAIDTTTLQMSKTIMVDYYPSSLTFDGSRVWVVDRHNGILEAIDPSTGQITPLVDLGYAPSAVTFDGARLWVANGLSNTVQAINPMSGLITPTFKVGNIPAALALAFDGTRLWVANSESHTVQSVDPKTGLINSFEVGNNPSALAFDGRRIWVANQDDTSVQAIDATANLVSQRIEIGFRPRGMVSDGTRLWVTTDYKRTVGPQLNPLDPSTNQVGLPVELGYEPRSNASGLIFDGTLLWVATGDTVIAIEPNSSRIVQTVTLDVNSFPYGLTFHDAQVWFATDNRVVRAIDPATGQISATINVGFSFDAFAFDNTQLWVINSLSNTMQAIELTTGQIALTFTVGGHPDAMIFDGKRLWIASSISNTVQAVDSTTYQVSPPILVGTEPSALAFDGVRVWVVNQKDDTVQSIDPETNRASVPIKVRDGGPHTLTVGGKRLWIANSFDDSVQYIVVQK